MCGIVFAAAAAGAAHAAARERCTVLSRLVARRGPDAARNVEWSCPTSLRASYAATSSVEAALSPSPAVQDRVSCELHAAVLHLRGPAIVPQPVERPGGDGSLLCFNGELFSAPSFEIPTGASDIAMLFGALTSEDNFHAPVEVASVSAECGAAPSDPTVSRILSVLTALRGEWAFLFYHAPSGRVFFGRDFLGRRSLLWHRPTSFDLTHGDDFFALSSVADLDKDVGWEEVPTTGIFSLSLQEFGSMSAPGKQSEDFLTLYPWSEDHAPDRPTLTLPASLTLNRALPAEADLPALDSISMRSESHRALPASHSSALEAFERALSESVRTRVELPPNQPLAILFSGGLDCSVLAALADRHLPAGVPVDLLNVAFENPRSLNAASSSASRKKKPGSGVGGESNPVDIYAVPDRRTGREAVEELRRICPGREWRFVEADVPFAEATKERQRVLGLSSPSVSVMDLSISIAFWFAARGRGCIRDGDNKTPYESTARVLLSGLGADEQLGGYSRHAARFSSDGWAGLLDELQLDVSRISSRNLGRDDRVISDHGKEVRFPYLDEAVVDFLSKTPVHIKTDPRLPKGQGDKMLLRLLASKMGLSRASKEAKRAVQFGARTAKMEDSKETGGMAALRKGMPSP
ncbi:Asparagine synthetase domain-containing protein 1 [Cladochytrium tenue]|nr:Asparagine synthetase domain-containing protein 1 [Cladochytrium tenue]